MHYVVRRVVGEWTGWEIHWALRELPNGPYVWNWTESRMRTFRTLAELHDYAKEELKAELVELPEWAGLSVPIHLRDEL